jgi:hypothetical protein
VARAKGMDRSASVHGLAASIIHEVDQLAELISGLCIKSYYNVYLKLFLIKRKRYDLVNGSLGSQRMIQVMYLTTKPPIE